MTSAERIDTDFLLVLLHASGTSSDERQPTALFRDYLSSHADETGTDMMGNSLMTANPDGSYRILLSAHIDEVGMQVVDICDNGLLKIRRVGGLNTLHVIGQEVEIHTLHGSRRGIIVAHTHGSCDNVPDIDDCFVDICCRDKEDAERTVHTGDYITFSPNARIVGDTVISKAVDNRAGVFVISQVFRRLAGRLRNVCLSVAATTQEEIGLRGMAVLARTAAPAVCLNVDVTDAMQISRKSLPLMGGGGVVYRNADSNPVLRRMLEECARASDIPLQTAVGRSVTGGTDSSRIQLFSPYTAVTDMSIPCKYMHTHHEQCSLSDISSCCSLLEAFVLYLDNVFPEAPPELTF